MDAAPQFLGPPDSQQADAVNYNFTAIGATDDTDFDSWHPTGFSESQIREILQSIQANILENSVLVEPTVEDFRSHESFSEKSASNRADKTENILPYSCSFCDAKLSNFVDYFKHRKKHLKEKPFKCNEDASCGESFNSEQNLELHLIGVHQLGSHSSRRKLDSEKLEGVLKCSECEKTFNRVSKFRAHLGSHQQDEYFTCEQCNATFEYLAEYEEHEYEHLQGRKAPKELSGTEFKCKLCGNFFLSKTTLTYHVDQKCKHPAVKNYVRKFRRRQRDPDNAQVPLKESRSATSSCSVYKCSVCGKGFARPNHVTRHMVVHTKERSFVCKTCGKSFSQKSSLGTHEKIHLASSGQNKDLIITCELCERHFVQRHNYKNHLRSCHRDLFGEDATDCFSCYLCNSTFNTESGLSAHVTRYHAGYSTVKQRIPFLGCDDRNRRGDADGDEDSPETLRIKNQRFRKVALTGQGDLNQPPVSESTKALTRHVFGPSVFNSGEFSIPRDLIPKSKEDSLYLIDSYSVVDEPDRYPVMRDPLKCSESKGVVNREGGVSSSRKHEPNDKLSNLDLHLRKVGPNGNFEASVCQFCGKEFKKACDLVRHIRKHTKEKPFPCPICKKDFVTRYARNHHMKQHDAYTRAKSKAVCSICKRVLSSTQALSVHMRTHSNAKHFNCASCQKEFITKGQLEVHLKTHEKVFTTLQRKDINEQPFDHIYSSSGVSGSAGRKELEEPLLVTSAGIFKSVSSRSEHEFKKFDKGQDRNRFACSKCDKTFRSAQYCKSHILSHETATYRQFSCSLCQKKFKTNVTLKHHLLKHFINDKKFQCSECPKIFAVKANLKWHKLVQHNTTKPFMCPYCGKSFKLRTLCKEHVETHRKEVESNEEAQIQNVKKTHGMATPESDAIAVGDAWTSLRIIPKPDSKRYGSEVTLLDVDDFLKESGVVNTNEYIKSKIKAMTAGEDESEEIEDGSVAKMTEILNLKERQAPLKTKYVADSNGSLPNKTVRDTVVIRPNNSGCLGEASCNSLSVFLPQNASETLSNLTEKKATTINNKQLPNILRKHRPPRDDTGKRFSERANFSRLTNLGLEKVGEKSVSKVVISATGNMSLDFPNRTKNIETSTSKLQSNPPVGFSSEDNTPAKLKTAPCYAENSASSKEFKCVSCGKNYPTNSHLKAHKLTSHSNRSSSDVKQSFGRKSSFKVSPETESELRKDETWTVDHVRQTKCKTRYKRRSNTLSRKLARYLQMKNRPAAPPIVKTIRTSENTCSECNLVFSTVVKLQKHFGSYHIIKPQCLSGSLSATGPPPKFKEPDFIRISGRDASDIKLKMAQTTAEDQLHNFTISEKILLRSIDEIDKEVLVEDKDSSTAYQRQLRLTQHKTFRCEDCPKAFSAKSALDMHIRSHTNERPFICSVCSNSFKTKSSLTYHVTSHRRTMKLFTCHLCKRQFATPSSLCLHMRLHSGATPLKCRFCPEKFSSSFKRQYHMEQKHLPTKLQMRRQKQAEMRQKRKLAVQQQKSQQSQERVNPSARDCSSSSFESNSRATSSPFYSNQIALKSQVNAQNPSTSLFNDQAASLSTDASTFPEDTVQIFHSSVILEAVPGNLRAHVTSQLNQSQSDDQRLDSRFEFAAQTSATSDVNHVNTNNISFAAYDRRFPVNLPLSRGFVSQDNIVVENYAFEEFFQSQEVLNVDFEHVQP